jgi:hypothetical protein
MPEIMTTTTLCAGGVDSENGHGFLTIETKQMSTAEKYKERRNKFRQGINVIG